MIQDLSAVVLAYNEQPNIRHCLESLKGLCEIHVVDSGSTDATVAICREYTPHVHVHAYTSHAQQWAWALEHLPLKGPWVLAMDADFVLTPQLRERLARELPRMPEGVGGVYVRHLYHFGGGLIRFGGTKSFWLRLVRRGRARVDTSDLVDFRFAVDGEVRCWREAVVEYNRHDDDISVWLRKQDKFALRLAVEEELRRAGAHRWMVKPRLLGNSDQRFVWLRERWLRLPLFIRPPLYFFYRYVLALGFLDGRAGFLYAALQGFWLRLVVDWKVAELRRRDLAVPRLRQLARTMLESRSGSVAELLGDPDSQVVRP